jgi:hypothetical protein
MNARSLTLSALALLATPVHAADLRVDVEVDPMAYALQGHSVHVGVGTGRFRFDVGAFGLELPAWAKPNTAFDAGFAGFGAKAHAHWFEDGTGPFAGVGLGAVRTVVQHRASGVAARDTSLGVGVEVGWLVPLVAGLYVKPWVGVSRTLGAEDVEVDGERFEAVRWQVFPTVHLGYVF